MMSCFHCGNIDKDPFLIFKIQGLDLLDNLNFQLENNDIKDISQLFNHEDNEKIGKADFSNIPNLHEQIFTLLDDDPVQIHFRQYLQINAKISQKIS